MPAEPAEVTAAGRAPDATVAAARRRRRKAVLNYTFLTILAVIVLFPLYVAVVGSLLPAPDIAKQPPPFLPLHPQWHTYSEAWSQGSMGLYLRNSLIATAIITVGEIVTSILSAYAFAFLNFPFKRTLFVIFLMTLMIPFEVTIATNLTTVTNLGWYNTFQGLTVPFLAWGFGTFLLRQAFLQLPKELEEAAVLDGYGHLRFMVRIAVPLIRPAIAALTVFAFLTAWNQYLWPLVVTGNNNVRTVQIGLKQLLGTSLQNINITLAGTVIAVIPLIILLVVFQKQLVRGITAGAVK